MEDERYEVQTVVYVSIQVLWCMTPCHCVSVFKYFYRNLCFAFKGPVVQEREKEKDTVLLLKSWKRTSEDSVLDPPKPEWCIKEKYFMLWVRSKGSGKVSYICGLLFGRFGCFKPCSVEVRKRGDWWIVMNLGRSSRKQVDVLSSICLKKVKSTMKILSKGRRWKVEMRTGELPNGKNCWMATRRYYLTFTGRKLHLL
jgi:hypothetical protein